MTTRSPRWGQQSIADRLGIAAYLFGVDHPWVARPFGFAVWGTDVQRFYASLSALAELPDGASVLDVPCGGGVAWRGLRPGQRLRYVAADISPDMLDRARGRAQRLGLTDVEFSQADIARLPFADQEFDVCVSFNGLHCLPDPAAAVAEITRCLRPGGRLIGDALVRGAGRRQDLAFAAMQRAGMFGVGGTVDELRGWLTDAGLTVQQLALSGAVAHFSAKR